MGPMVMGEREGGRGGGGGREREGGGARVEREWGKEPIEGGKEGGGGGKEVEFKYCVHPGMGCGHDLLIAELGCASRRGR